MHFYLGHNTSSFSGNISVWSEFFNVLAPYMICSMYYEDINIVVYVIPVTATCRFD